MPCEKCGARWFIGKRKDGHQFCLKCEQEYCYGLIKQWMIEGVDPIEIDTPMDMLSKSMALAQEYSYECDYVIRLFKRPTVTFKKNVCRNCAHFQIEEKSDYYTDFFGDLQSSLSFTHKCLKLNIVLEEPLKKCEHKSTIEEVTSGKLEGWKCKYCKRLNEKASLTCVNCGASK